LFSKEAGQPASAATHIQDIIIGPGAHAIEYGKDDGQMLLLHAFAATRFRPAIKFLTKQFGMSLGIRRDAYLRMRIGLLP